MPEIPKIPACIPDRFHDGIKSLQLASVTHGDEQTNPSSSSSRRSIVRESHDRVTSSPRSSPSCSLFSLRFTVYTRFGEGGFRPSSKPSLKWNRCRCASVVLVSVLRTIGCSALRFDSLNRWRLCVLRFRSPFLFSFLNTI